ncbi:MAG: hemolysin family protein [Planctomycetes bacterium]|nr:hemolysin family protein [Planctomycetota bacterium]
MTLLFLAWIADIAVTMFLSAINLAIVQVSDTALLRRLERGGRSATDHWIFKRKTQIDHAVAFLRAMGRVGIFALLLIQIVDVGENGHLAWQGLGVAFLASATCIWLFTSVISAAFARYAPVTLIVASMPLLRLIDLLLRPLVTVAEIVDEGVRRLVGATTPHNESGAELLESIEDTKRQGGIDSASAAIMENVVELSETLVASIMTPRTAIEGMEYTDDLKSIREVIHEEGHSRIPIYEGSLDHVVGVLYVKDLVRWLGAAAPDFSLRPLLRQPIRVPETKRVRDLLKEFQRGKVHMALVVDEYGGTAGLVTIEDVLEEIVGEIRDEHEAHDEEDPAIRELAVGRIEADGRCSIADVNAKVELSIPEDEGYDTIAGFVLSVLGRVPESGVSFESHGARFRVLESTPTLVSKVAIEPLAKSQRR